MSIYAKIESDAKATAVLDGILQRGDKQEKANWVDVVIVANEKELKPLLSKSVTLDSVKDAKQIEQATANGQIVMLDGIEEGSEPLHAIVPLREIMMDAIETEGISANQMYSILDNAIRLSESDRLATSLDGVNELVGAEIVRQTIVGNANVIIHSSLNGAVGHISNFEQVAGNGMGTNFTIYSHEHIVTDGKGNLKTNTVLDSRNIFSDAGTLGRKGVIKKVAGVLEYEYDVKIAKDGDNYPIKVGRTSVDFGFSGVTLDDQGADQHDTTYTTDKNIKGGEKVTLEIDYALGKVKLKLQSNNTLPDGAILAVLTQLDDSKLEEIRTLLGEKFTSYVYTASPVDIGTKVRIDHEKEIRRNIGKTLLPSGMRSSMDIITSGHLQESIFWMTNYADVFEALNIEFNLSLSSINEYYKLLLDSVSRGATELMNRTNILGANNILILGGSGLEKIFNLSHSGINTNTHKTKTSANGFRQIGRLNGDYPSYYYPLYDEENPKCNKDGVVSATAADNVYDSITLVGMPVDATKALVIKGITDPIAPNKVNLNANNEILVFLHGQVIIMPNKDPRSKQLSTKILFRS